MFPSQKDVIVNAVETYLDKKDPLRIRNDWRGGALRAATSEDNRSDIWHASVAADTVKETSEFLDPHRPSIPAVARHEVWLRGQASMQIC